MAEWGAHLRWAKDRVPCSVGQIGATRAPAASDGPSLEATRRKDSSRAMSGSELVRRGGWAKVSGGSAFVVRRFDPLRVMLFNRHTVNHPARYQASH